MINIGQLLFENTLVNTFTADTDTSTQTRLTPGVIFSYTNPTPVHRPEIIAWSDSAAELLDLPKPETMDGQEAFVFAGNQLAPGSNPYSTRYGGHQFGSWAGQLGDGRAISLGEVVNSKKERIEIQLKGAGPTPYSRRADGRAVLRSSLREFLCSEAMFNLQIPTTRALCCTLTNEQVIRDMFYDGRPQPEPGAITTRLAPTFLRIGHFEILTASGEFQLLKELADYTINQHFPEITDPSSLKYSTWLTEVCIRTAKLMVSWMRVGFVHGVMNTDNLSILGLTIDYGPYGWLDIYDPEWTPNTTDNQLRRYRFGNQANIAFWNLTKLAQSLAPLIETEDEIQAALTAYQDTFEQEIMLMMSNKLGFQSLPPETTWELLTSLDQVLQSTEIDPTIFYRLLPNVLEEHSENWSQDFILGKMKECFYDQKNLREASLPLISWVKSYLRIQQDNPLTITERRKLMNKNNPYFILRNYLVQEALDELATGKRNKLDLLMQALQTPYEENEITKKFFKRRPEWARDKAGCSALSCSS